MPKVLVTDPIAQDGIDLLAREVEVDVKVRPSPDELVRLIAGYDALVVRSETKVTKEVIEAGARLQVIGRAGMGVDNIDLETATRRGVVVVNAPTGNTISAAEHTIALMLALARHLPEAHASLRSGRWERQRFLGSELRGKTLGLIGLGQVGSEVARRARGLDMRVVAHDPYVSAERAQSMGAELLSQDELLEQSDFISLHVALTSTNRDLLGDQQLRRVKRGAYVINTARGELIDEAALVRAIPEEARERFAVDVAEEVLPALRGEPARYAVNAPLVSPETMEVLRPFLDVAERTASLATQLCEGQLTGVELEYLGEIANHDEI